MCILRSKYDILTLIGHEAASLLVVCVLSRPVSSCCRFTGARGGRGERGSPGWSFGCRRRQVATCGVYERKLGSEKEGQQVRLAWRSGRSQCLLLLLEKEEKYELSLAWLVSATTSLWAAANAAATGRPARQARSHQEWCSSARAHTHLHSRESTMRPNELPPSLSYLSQ